MSAGQSAIDHDSVPPRRSVAVIGAGPAGLTAGYLLARQGLAPTVLEAHPTLVGGISRTESYKGFLFDIGGHRFFSKSQAVEALWDEILGEPLLRRPRKSRIFYRGRFFDYPLKPGNALRNLGLLEAALCVASYGRARLLPVAQPRSFQDWVTNHFGARLFRIFFRTYTEKVWGIPCSEISADWAAQRIRGLSLPSAIWQALRGSRGGASSGAVIKTLIDSFRYPRRGPGMMWDAAAAKTRAAGGEILLGCEATRLSLGADGGWTVTWRAADGSERRLSAAHVISSMPLRHLVQCLEPKPPAEVIAAAADLRYRDFLVVPLIVRDAGRFDDNWLYIHEPGVSVGRIQNFKAWSPDMVPDPALSCYGMEYFCSEGDALWARGDAELVETASRELVALGLAQPGEILDGCVVRQRKAYPVYDQDYAARVQLIRRALTAYPNLHLVGRNGMHKYNNQDHAMMTAMLTVENIIAGHERYDVWRVNEDAEYHEAGSAGARQELGLRATPARVAPAGGPV